MDDYLGWRVDGIISLLMFIIELDTKKIYEVSLVKKVLLGNEKYIKRMIPTIRPM